MGIGTTSPGTTLDVTGTARFSTSVTTGLLNATNITATNIVGTNVSAGTLSFSNANITTVSAGTLRYTSAIGSNETLGALLVTGNTLPLHVFQSNQGNNTIARMVGSGGSGNIYSIESGCYFNGTIGTARLSFTDDGLYSSSINFSTKQSGSENTNMIERMRITSTGLVGIGTTAPTQVLEVNGTARVNSANNLYNKLLVLYDVGTGDAVSSATAFYGFGINSGTLRYQVNGSTDAHRFYCAGTNYYQITNAGGANVSDRRYKTDVVNITDALSKIAQLQGITFKMQDVEKRQMGFVAQDVESIVPEVVQVGDDDTRFMSYDKLTALLVEGIKEQKAQIDELTRFIQSKFPSEFNQ